MAITNASYSQYMKLKESFVPGCPGYIDTYETYGWRLARSTATADNPTESRPKPKLVTYEDVRNNLTAQLKQYHEQRRNGIYRVGPSKVGTYYCTEQGVTLDRYQYTWTRLSTGTRVGVAPNTNWGLKFRLKVKDELLNLGQSIFEYKETCKLFADTSRALKTGWDLYRGNVSSLGKKRLRKKLQTPCSVSAAQLNSSFAIKPLISDLQDSYFSLQERLDNPFIKRVTVRDFAKTSGNLNGKEWEWGTSERAIVYLEMESDYGIFTPGNILEVSWELIPFSFVVDWMIPIGDTLSSLDALKNVKSVKGTVTRKEHYYHRYWPSTWEINPNYTEITKTDHTYDSHQRTVIYDVPLPRVPTWDPSQSYKAVMNALALLHVLRKC